MSALELAAGAALGQGLLGLLALLAGGRGGTFVHLAAAVLSGATAVAGGLGLAAAAPETLVLPLGVPWTGLALRLDPLAGAFLLLAGTGGAAACLYAVGYGRHEAAQARMLPFTPLFLGAMAMVPLADDAFGFLFFWEAMSVLSWALVMVRHEAEGTQRAGYVYLVMAGTGAAALLLAFALLAGAAGSGSFAAMRAAPPEPGVAAAVLALALVGAGSKAGLVPFHAWLPLAHPAAPSHISALMSGVMTKIALCGLIRIVFDLLGPPEWWWALPFLLAGAVSAFTGVLTALMETDLKRVLAASTIENVGIIVVALGLALAFAANGAGAAAAVALTAALLHALNHMAMKSLLFFGAGAVIVATGHGAMDRLGGLLRRMPQTGFAMLAGAMAISALPPMNGFASEWLAFQAVLLSPALPDWGLRLAIPAAGGVMALSAALAAAAFVRVFGVVFLGRPRSAEAGAAQETDAWSRGAMVGLAGLCLLGGLVPGVLIDALGPAVRALAGEGMPAQRGLPWLTLVPLAEGRSSYNGLLVGVFVAVSAGLAALAIHRLAHRTTRIAPAWDCGFPDPSPATQYTALSFAQPVRRVFATTLLSARERVEMPGPGETGPARFRLSIGDPAWTYVVAPVARTVWGVAGRVDALRRFTMRQSLGLALAALVLVLMGLVLWG